MMRKSSDSTSPDRTKKNSGGFRALAEKWQQRAEEDTSAPPQPQLVRRESATRLDTPTRPTRLYDERSPSGDSELGRPSRPSRLYDDSSDRTTSVDSTLDRPTRPSRLYDDAADEDNTTTPTRPTCLFTDAIQSSSNSSNSDVNNPSLEIPRAEVPDRKLSMPEYSSAGVKMRDRREGNSGGAPSRPTSLIEGGDSGVMDSHYLNSAGAPLSPAASTDSRDDLFSTPETPLSASKEVLDAFSRPRPVSGVSIPRSGASNIPKMADIMRAFERHDLGKRGAQGVSSSSSHPRMSSLDSTTSDEGSLGNHYGSVTSLASGQRDQYGSITSLASSTSLISPQVSKHQHFLTQE